MLLLNQAFARACVHISMQAGQIVSRAVGYVRLLDTPESRRSASGFTPVLLFLTSLQLDGCEVDEGVAHAVKMQVRKRFLRPAIFDYGLIKGVIKQFNYQTFSAAVLRAIAEQQIYHVGQSADDVFGGGRAAVAQVLRRLNADLKAGRAERQRAYGFLHHCVEGGVSGGDQGTGAGARYEPFACRNRCCRCGQRHKKRTVPLKMLLAEPILYFRSKFCFSINIHDLLIRDCYAILHVCLYKDLSVMQYRDQAYKYIKNQ